MFKLVKFARSRWLGSIATGVLAAIAMGGTVAAITEAEFLYSPTKTGYYSIHPMDMSAQQSATTFQIDYHPPSGTTEHCFHTGVHLPQGARITQLAVWYRSLETYDPFVYLVRTSLSDGLSAFLLTAGGVSDDTGLRKLAIVPLKDGSTPISNIGFAYGFGFCPGPDGQFEGARIAYTYSNAGD